MAWVKQLMQFCSKGYNCSSGDCEYPESDLCAEVANYEPQAHGNGDGQHGGQIFIGSTVKIENLNFMSPGATARSSRTEIAPALAQNRHVERSKSKIDIPTPPQPTLPQKSAHEVWGGVLASMWRDGIGLVKAVAPWFFGSEVLKTAFTAPNNYVAVGDDLTSGGGDNNTSRGDYVSKITPAVAE